MVSAPITALIPGAGPPPTRMATFSGVRRRAGDLDELGRGVAEPRDALRHHARGESTPIAGDPSWRELHAEAGALPRRHALAREENARVHGRLRVAERSRQPRPLVF